MEDHIYVVNYKLAPSSLSVESLYVGPPDHKFIVIPEVSFLSCLGHYEGINENVINIVVLKVCFLYVFIAEGGWFAPYFSQIPVSRNIDVIKLV